MVFSRGRRGNRRLKVPFRRDEPVVMGCSERVVGAFVLV